MASSSRRPTYTFTIGQHLEGDYYKCTLTNSCDDWVCQVEPSCLVPKATVPEIQAATLVSDGYITNNTGSEYSLTVYCRAKLEYPKGSASPPRFAVVTESFDCTWTTWFHKHLSQITTANKDKLADQRATLLIRSLISGADDMLFNSSTSHNMDPNHIYIVGSSVKFAHFDKVTRSRDDQQQSVFQLLRASLPQNVLTGELLHFIGLQTNCTRERFLFYRLHPGISNGDEMCSLRLHSFETSKIQGLGLANKILNKSRDTAYTSIVKLWNKHWHNNWLSRITSTRLRALGCYSLYLNKKKPLPVADFVNFSRAAVEHANDKKTMSNDPISQGLIISYEEVDEELNNAWPQFMILWFDCCVDDIAYYGNMFHFSTL